MSTLLRPTGSLPPRVYWARRLVVLLVAVVVVALAVLVVNAVTGDDADDPAGTPAATGTPSDAPSPAATGEGGVAICAEGALDVALEANGSTFAPGVEPAFTVTLTNSTDAPCLVEVSDETRTLTITSGPARVWGSADCTESKARTLLVGSGKSESSIVTWDRTRSEEGCPRKGVEAKPGTYRVTATVLGRTTDEVVLVLS